MFQRRLVRVYEPARCRRVRAAIHHVYERLKRNKALPGIGGLGVAVKDGHESDASYRRMLCLKRTVQRRDGQVQYYQSHTAVLDASHGPAATLLGRAATARRWPRHTVLLARVSRSYPRAFDSCGRCLAPLDSYWGMAKTLGLDERRQPLSRRPRAWPPAPQRGDYSRLPVVGSRAWCQMAASAAAAGGSFRRQRWHAARNSTPNRPHGEWVG